MGKKIIYTVILNLFILSNFIFNITITFADCTPVECYENAIELLQESREILTVETQKIKDLENDIKIIKKENINLKESINTISTKALPIGSILIYSGTITPKGFLPCDGRSLTKSEYQEIFSIIGFSYGGDNANIFNLPDLRGRFPLGLDNIGGNKSNRVPHPVASHMGNSGGEAMHSLTADEIPNHSHDYWDIFYSEHYPWRCPTGWTCKYIGLPHNLGSAKSDNDNNGKAIKQTTFSSNCKNMPHNNIPPFQTFFYMIKVK